MGALRVFLALCVISAHIGGSPEIRGFFSGSAMAVCVFFCISGFYMALVLNEKYTGEKEFYIARLFRIYPIYFAAIFLELLILAITPHGLLYFFGRLLSIPLWAATLSAVTNVTLVGMDVGHWLCMPSLKDGSCVDSGYFVLNAPGWSLGIELMFYAIVPFIARSAIKSAIFMAAGGGYLLWVGSIINYSAISLGSANFIPYGLSYNTFPASMLYFGIGMLSYHLVHRRRAMLSLIVGACLYSFGRSGAILHVQPHILVVLFFLPLLFSLTKNMALDRFIGELSFPLYIFHMPILHAVEVYFYKSGSSVFKMVVELVYYEMGHFMFCIVATTIIAALVVVVLEPLINRLKTQYFPA